MVKSIKKIISVAAAMILGVTALSVSACVHEHTPGTAVKENEIAASCTANGSYEEVVYCTECNDELSREPKTVEKSAHTSAAAIRENEVAASCSVKGSYDEVVKCSVCGAELSRESKTIELTAHTPAEAVKENEINATCTSTGSYDDVIYCEDCGAEISRIPKTADMLSHSYEEEYSSDSTGHWYKCADCDDKKDFHAHIPGAAATETTAQTCTECGYVIAVALGHKHSLTPVAAVEATCTADGNIAYYTCDCTQWFTDDKAGNLISDHSSVTVKATGHAYSSEWASDETNHWHAATCVHTELKNGRALHDWDNGEVEGDIKTYTCNVCKKTKTEQIVSEQFVGEQYIVKHEEGEVTYKFEAECTNLGGKSGPGWSGNTGGKSMAVVADNADNEGVVSYLYRYNVSVNFVIVCDRDVEDATLKLRVGAEFIDMLIDATTFGVRVDPVHDADLTSVEEGGAWGSWDSEFLNYYDDENEDGAPFEGYRIDAYDCGQIHIDASNTKRVIGIDDFVITTNLSLKRGVNSISFITLNKQSVGGTMEACAPVIDGIKITTTAQLGLYDPQDNGFGALNAVIIED